MPDRRPSNPRFRYRSCSRKVEHATKFSAFLALVDQVDRTGDEDLIHRIHAYHCNYCDHWHLGRRLPYQIAQARKVYAKQVEQRRRRSLWDSSAVPVTAYQLWLERCSHLYRDELAAKEGSRV